jgi:hypothetical protein
MSELKDLALRLVAACEEFYFEKCLYQTLLEGTHVRGWQKHYDEMLQNPEMRAKNRETFAPIRAAIEQEGDAEAALNRFLNTLPVPEKLN